MSVDGTGILQTKDYRRFRIQTESGIVVAEFEGAKAAGKALPDDLVQWNPTEGNCTVLQRAKLWPIIGVLELTSKTKYGMTSRGVPIYLFTPCDKRYPYMIVGCSERNVSKNQLAVVDFDSWTTTSLPRGTLCRLLGPCGDAGAEREALVLTYNPFKAIKCAEVGADLPIDWSGREVCPPLTFNIDPIGCRDIDDVLSLEEGGDWWDLWITIADVAEIVESRSLIDEHASLQAFTAYDNGRAVKPMLPHAYSEGHCSLLPRTERPGLSLVVRIWKDRMTEIHSVRWCKSKVLNARQFDYDTFLEKAEAAGIQTQVLAEFAKGILGRATQDPHEWIEACMLKYNMEAAKVLREAGAGILRKHDEPDMEMLASYTILGGPALAVLANKAAQYCPANDSEPLHYGLNASVYCHASSPIRRYADLVNQRVIKAVLAGQTFDQSVGQSTIGWLNQRQTDLKRFERDLFLLDQISSNAVGQIKALILDLQTFDQESAPMKKLKLWIPDWKRVFTWKTAAELPEAVGKGVEIQLSYFVNPAVRFWKEKVVFRFDSLY
jgi:exoribonuclease R